MKRALLLDPENMLLHYKIGCSLLQQGEVDESLKYLEPVTKMMRRPSLVWWSIDPELDPIREDPRFQALMDAAQDRITRTDSAANNASFRGFDRP
jgi:adenylate cyclase